MVQDCYAAFTDKSLVFSHAWYALYFFPSFFEINLRVFRFHDNLEKLGVSQPTLRSFPAFFPLASQSAPTPSSPSPPPPGYITLGATGLKSKEVHREPESESRVAAYVSPSEQAPKEEDAPVRNSSPLDLKENDRQTPPNPRSSFYEYISRIISENSKPSAGCLYPQQSYPPPMSRQSPYMALQNSSEIASLVRSQSCTLPESKEQEALKNANSSPADGYIHVKAG